MASPTDRSLAKICASEGARSSFEGRASAALGSVWVDSPPRLDFGGGDGAGVAVWLAGCSCRAGGVSASSISVEATVRSSAAAGCSCGGPPSASSRPSAHHHTPAPETMMRRVNPHHKRLLAESRHVVGRRIVAYSCFLSSSPEEGGMRCVESGPACRCVAGGRGLRLVTPISTVGNSKSVEGRV
jgi:hypothetical protein